MKETFLDFQFFYDLDLWDANYESYSIIQDQKIVSNVCLYKTRLIHNGHLFDALSVGAVTTKSGYRERGYSRKIMEHIINKYPNTPMYLFANESVIDFYPRFGFEQIYQKLPVANYFINNNIEPQKINVNRKLWDYVYQKVNYSSVFDCLDAASIYLFHLLEGALRDCIYDLPELETIVIAQKNKNILKLIGVFSLKAIPFADLLKYLPFSGIDTIEFDFMPCWKDCQYTMTTYQQDPMFVRNMPDSLEEVKFPELAMT